METFIGALLYQCMQPRQLPLAPTGRLGPPGWTDTVCALFARARSRDIRHSCATVGHWDPMRVCTVPEDSVGAELAEPAKRPAARVPGRPEKSAI